MNEPSMKMRLRMLKNEVDAYLKVRGTDGNDDDDEFWLEKVQRVLGEELDTRAHLR